MHPLLFVHAALVVGLLTLGAGRASLSLATLAIGTAAMVALVALAAMARLR